MNEIIFLIQEAPEGGYKAHALGHSVFTQAATEEELRAKIQEVTVSHFGPSHVAKIVTGFEHAPETKVDIFQPYVDEIIRACGFEPEECLVTDESIIFDLAGSVFVEGPCDVSAIADLGVEVTEHDFVWEVAARLKQSREE